MDRHRRGRFEKDGDVDLDPTNRRILAELARNARQSTAAIARAVHLSRQAVQDRIRAMEDQNIITGYHAAVTEAAAPLRAMILLQFATRPCAPALTWLSEVSGITYVASLAGEWDAMAMIAVADTDALTQLNDQIAKSPLIERAQSQIILKEQR
ncbi:transcriptional regulator, AsnC family [Ruegeria sp. TM1040]|nr:transcriptional regulator, AsnC family [Ruegeria sp. TM1040]